MNIRIFFLLATLGISLYIWIKQANLVVPSFVSLRSTPINCTGEKSSEFISFIGELNKLRYPGSQLSYRNSEGAWTHCAIGWANTNWQGTPMTHEHRLRYLSLSKLFTTSVSLKLLDQNIIYLDTLLIDIIDIGPELQDKRIQLITLFDLLTHRGGFNRELSGDPMLVEAPWCPKNISEISNLRLDYTPGDVFSYSNLGYCLLGVAIENKLNKPFEVIVNEFLLEPLDLIDYIKPVINGLQFQDEATLHVDPKENFDILNFFDYSSMHATGSWSGNSKDFGRVMEMILIDNDGLLKIKQSYINITNNCDDQKWRSCHGIGMYRFQDNEKTIYWRDGSMPGGTSMLVISENNEIVIFITNSRRKDWLPENDKLGILIFNFLSNNPKRI